MLHWVSFQAAYWVCAIGSLKSLRVGKNGCFGVRNEIIGLLIGLLIGLVRQRYFRANTSSANSK